MAFENPMPELGVAPPSTSGAPQVPTKLHALRLRQLQDLAKAFDITLPASATTKDKILPYMIQAEEAGTFRSQPVSQYHLLHAQLNQDSTTTFEQRLALKEQLRKAEWKEFPPEGVKAKNLFFRLQQQCKVLGLNSMGKSIPEMRKMIAEAGKEPEADESAAEAG